MLPLSFFETCCRCFRRSSAHRRCRTLRKKAGRLSVISVIGEGSNDLFCQVIINRLFRTFPSGTESPVPGAYFKRYAFIQLRCTSSERTTYKLKINYLRLTSLLKQKLHSLNSLHRLKPKRRLSQQQRRKSGEAERMVRSASPELSHRSPLTMSYFNLSK